MNEIQLVFPNQLFAVSDQLVLSCPVYILEEYLFFKQYNFHKQKIAYQRASMKFYADYLREKGYDVHYIESTDVRSDIRVFIASMKAMQIKKINFTEPSDNWLEKRIMASAKENDISLKAFKSPQWLNSRQEIHLKFDPSKSKYFQSIFYKKERLERSILLTTDQLPVGGKWSFDEENRSKYPKKNTPPKVPIYAGNVYYKEATSYVLSFFQENPGELDEFPIYPLGFIESENWLQEFLENRLNDFGTFEDAIVLNEKFLHHAIISPLLNVGFLTPDYVLQRVIQYAETNKVPINSTEGFVRQIMGWREFTRGVYLSKGKEERTKNYWGFSRKIPLSFYQGTTGIFPIDETIKKILETGYCHHIERLMVLGNFMLLCEFDPDEVYKWFMEMFIDSYDWVMVPNVYGMSQFADGGLLSTKPYISSSNYLMKMSDYPKGQWQEIWDALFWRFISQQSNFFSRNPRTNMMVRNYEKMSQEKRVQIEAISSAYLNSLQ